MFSLKDKVALVTGASQGIGRETALALAQAGAKVAVAARNEEKLTTLVTDILAAGGDAIAIKMDVADPEQIKSGFKQTLEKFARLDILVNNAAITRDGLALRMKQEDWDAVIRTNLTGAHLCIQQALSTMMRARAGRIINIASVVAQMGNAGQANYVAAKAGLVGLTKAIAIEIASRNITVNAVAPGFIATPMTDVLSDKVKDELKASHPARTHGLSPRRSQRHRFLGERRSRLHHRPRPRRQRWSVSGLCEFVREALEDCDERRFEMSEQREIECIVNLLTRPQFEGADSVARTLGHDR